MEEVKGELKDKTAHATERQPSSYWLEVMCCSMFNNWLLGNTQKNNKT